MSDNPDSKSDVPECKADDSASKPASHLPRWIPRWMGERERAAFILAIGIVLAAAIVSIGILIALDNIK